MASYKLEDNIREKLEAREIKPSAEAWKKLEGKLDAEQPKKKTVGWYYMAASFVGLLILGSLFFVGNNSEFQNEIVKQKNIENASEIVPNNSRAEEVVSAETDSEKVETSENKKKSNREANSNILKTLPQKKSEIDKKVDKTKMLATVKNEEIQQPQPLENSFQKNEEDKLFNNKVDEVVATVKKLQENNIEITAMEVEKLLNNARRDIQTQQILSSPKVDATALLQNVEWELEKSFRDKVFDALGDGFRKIRTAVIERND